MSNKAKRYGMVIGVKKGKLKKYKELHADCWPKVLDMISESKIKNYSIYLGELEKGKWYLFSYFEYTGDNFKADMDLMAADVTTQEWWRETDPCQEPCSARKEGEFWMSMEEVFHTD